MEEWRLRLRLDGIMEWRWAKEEIFLLYKCYRNAIRYGKARNIEFVIDYSLIKNIPKNHSVFPAKRREILGNMIFGRLLRGMLKRFRILIILWCKRDKASIPQIFEWFDGPEYSPFLLCTSQFCSAYPRTPRESPHAREQPYPQTHSINIFHFHCRLYVSYNVHAEISYQPTHNKMMPENKKNT